MPGRGAANPRMQQTLGWRERSTLATMSSYPAGWYPDGSGRFAQRYYDGNTWTEHVLDARGNRGTDPVGLGAPAQYGAGGGQYGSAQPSGGGQQYGGGSSPYFGGGQPSGSGQQYGGGQYGGGQTQTQYGTAQGGWASGAAAATTSTESFVVTLGHALAGIGAIVLLLSLFVLDFLSGDDQRASLGDVSDAPGDVAGFLLGSYAGVGRFLALLVIVLAVLAALRLPAFGASGTRLPLIAAVTCGVFALWHLLAMLVVGDFDASPTFDAFLGLVAYAALAAGPYVRRPLTS